jgi:glutathione S-transferase
VIDSYAYPCLITQIVIQRMVMPMLGNATDEAAIGEALPQAEACLRALERLIDGNTYLAGDTLSRADLLLIPVYDYFSQTPEGQKLLGAAPNLKRWWDQVRSRPSVERTRPSLG